MTDTNGTAAASHTPDVGPSNPSVLSGSTGTFVIQSNTMQETGTHAGFAMLAYDGTVASTVKISEKIITGTPIGAPSLVGGGGIHFRSTNASNQSILWFTDFESDGSNPTGNVLHLSSIDGGGETEVAGRVVGSGLAAGETYTMELYLTSTGDADAILTRASTGDTWPISFVYLTNLSATTHGPASHLGDPTNNNPIAFDDFKACPFTVTSNYLEAMFTGNDGDPLNSYAPEVGSISSAHSGTWTIQGDKAQPLNSETGSNQYIAWDESHADIFARDVVTLAASTSGVSAAGYVFRYSDSSNYWIAQLKNDGHISLDKVVSGSQSNVASITVSITAGVQYVLNLNANGNDSAFWITDDNNTVREIAATDSFNATATKHGLFSTYNGSVTGSHTFDVLEIGAPVTVPTTTTSTTTTSTTTSTSTTSTTTSTTTTSTSTTSTSTTTTTAGGGTEGPYYLGTAVTDSSEGVGTGWTITGSIAGSSLSGSADFQEVNQNDETKLLRVTNFGVGSEIPDGVTITGYLVEIYGTSPAGPPSVDFKVQLWSGGAFVGTNQSTGQFFATPGWVSFGGSGNNFGASLTGADVKNSGFGVAISFVNTFSGGGAVQVNGVRITFTW